MLRQSPLYDWVFGNDPWELFSPKVVVISDSEYQKKIDEIKERQNNSRKEFLNKMLKQLDDYMADTIQKHDQAAAKKEEILSEIAKLDKPTEEEK